MSLAIRLRHDFGPSSIDLALDLPSQGVTALFGPSGAGKSLTILTLAGLFRPQLCRFAIDGQVLDDSAARIRVPPEQRRLGLVFQDARLFPHLSVAANLRYGQRRAPAPALRRAAPRARADDVIDLLALAPLLTRRPHTLSGGERQRVAIGRALLAQPRLLLMDEPLANLDQPRRAEILPYLTRLADAFALPILYVTHALDEVIQLADHVVLLRAGRLVASGPLADITARGDLPLAQRNDAAAILTGTIAHHDPARALTTLALADYSAAILTPLLPQPPGTRIRLRIPAREVILALPAAAPLADLISLHNILPGIVRAISPDPSRNARLVELTLGAQTLLSRITQDAVTRLNLAPGSPALALVKSVAVEVVGPG